ncbi:hypothetical protein V2I01_09655 [Micromonospora sp. BRA006-A]|nr:hypothetical protein [Micromonospora sp. BRA006-A]
MVAVTLAAAVAVVILLPPVVLLFPALGMGMGAVAALVAVLLGLAVLPVVDLLHPRAGGQRGLLALRARAARRAARRGGRAGGGGARRGRPRGRPLRRRASRADPSDVRAGRGHREGGLAQSRGEAAAVDRRLRRPEHLAGRRLPRARRR